VINVYSIGTFNRRIIMNNKWAWIIGIIVVVIILYFIFS